MRVLTSLGCLGLCAAVLVLVAGPCLAGAKPGGTLRIAMYADATSLDPGGANDIPSQKAYNLLFDTLLTFDKNMQLVGHVATMRSIVASYCHLTRLATASPATWRKASTMPVTVTAIPGRLIERVCANRAADTS